MQRGQAILSALVRPAGGLVDEAGRRDVHDEAREAIRMVQDAMDAGSRSTEEQRPHQSSAEGAESTKEEAASGENVASQGDLEWAAKARELADAFRRAKEARENLELASQQLAKAGP